MIRSSYLKFYPFLFVILLTACGDKQPPLASQSETGAQNQSGYVALMGSNGFYAACEVNSTTNLVVNRPTIGEWETLSLTDLGGGRVAIKAANGKFVSADRKKGGILIANRDEAGEWETFEVVVVEGDRVSLRTLEGLYVSADQTRGDTLVADRMDASDWEIFTLVRNVPAPAPAPVEQ